MEAITAEVVDSKTKQDARGRKIADEARHAEVLGGYEASGMTQKAYARRKGSTSEMGDENGVGALFVDREFKVTVRVRSEGDHRDEQPVGSSAGSRSPAIAEALNMTVTF